MASYVLTFEEHPDHLVARVSARFDSLALALRYWAEIAAECRARLRDQVLVVRNVRVSEQRSDTFQIAAALRDLGFSSMRIAYVDESPGSHAATPLGEAIALQRGIEAKSFMSVERATMWLVECADFAPPLYAHAGSAA